MSTPDTSRPYLRIQSDAIPLSAALDCPCAVILGEAGSGKSDIIRSLYTLTKEQRGDPSVRHIDLGHYSSEREIHDDIEQAIERHTRSAPDGADITIILDSLDEARQGINNVAGWLKRWLSGSHDKRFRLILACRTTQWLSILDKDLAQRFGDNNVKYFDVMPLTRENVSEAADANALDADTFVAAIVDRGVIELASSPLTLNLLLRLYRRGGSLPTSRTDIICEALFLLCAPTPERADLGHTSGYSAQQLFDAASAIAAITTLTARPTIATNPHIDEDQHHTLERLAAPLSSLSSIDPSAMLSIATDALGTAIFRSHAPNIIRFAHRACEEFLAAHWLANSNWTLDQLQDALTVPRGDSLRCVAPQLRDTTSWLAALRPDWRTFLAGSEPLLILESDAILSNPSLAEQITASLFIKAASGSEVRLSRRSLRRLNHPLLAEQLRQYLTDDYPTTARDLALDIAEAVPLPSLENNLRDLALRESASLSDRAAACAALKPIANDQTRLTLAPLCHLSSDAAHAELRGAALDLCWPTTITPAVLLDALEDIPATDHYTRFDRFLGSLTEEVDAFPASHLPMALEWARRHVGVRRRRDYVTPLCRAFTKRAFVLVEENPAICDALAAYIVERALAHELGGPFDQDEDEAFFASEETKRKLLICAVLRIWTNRFEPFYLVYGDNNIARVEDICWLFQQAAASQNVGFVNRCCKLINQLFTEVFSSEHLDAWIEACNRSSLVVECMPVPQARNLRARGEPDGIESRNEKAQWLRRRHSMRRLERRNTEHEQQSRQLQSEALRACRESEQDAFAKVHRVLAGTSHLDITRTDGWENLNQQERDSVEHAAIAFLHDPPYNIVAAPSESDSFTFGEYWISGALMTVASIRPVALLSLSCRFWSAFGPSIFNYLKREQGATAIFAAMHSQFPEIFRLEFVNRMKRARSGPSEPDVLSIDLQGADQDLMGEVDQALNLPNWGAEAFAGVVVWLVEHGYYEALTRAERMIQDEQATVDLSVAVTSRCLPLAIDRLWPQIWLRAQTDRVWGRSLFQNVAWRGHGTDVEFYKSLSTEDCFALLDWLLEEYPVASDPPLSSYDDVRRFRDSVLHHLSARGDDASIEGLRSLQHTEGLLSLGWHIARAEEAAARSQWRQLQLQDLVRMTEATTTRFVNDADRLFDLVLTELAHYEANLRVDNRCRRILWHQSDMDAHRHRPNDEDALSADIVDHLRQTIGRQGVIANREVQVSRRVIPEELGGEAGQRLDIIVDAVSSQDQRRLSLVVEVKGSWNRDAKTSMQSQLVDRYLASGQWRHGIYVVGWFAAATWSPQDNRRISGPWDSLEEMTEDLKTQAASLSQNGRVVRAVVIDCSLR